jgi:hypothetical protein
MRNFKALFVAAALLASTLLVLRGGPAAAADNSGEFIGLAPKRILDTRDGTGQGGTPGALGPAATIDVQVANVGGVPASDVAAVILNVTVTQPTAGSWLTIWPKGAPRNQISNLNFEPGQTVANLVTVGLGGTGQVSVFNQFGATHVIFDVVGYYSNTDGIAGARYLAVPAQRLFDTRDGSGGVTTGRVQPGADLHYHFNGAATENTPGVTGVILNVTAVQPTAGGWLTVYPDDVQPPLASNLNYLANQDVPNLVTVRVPPSGNVNFRTALGAAYVLADVVGYYTTGAINATNQGRFVPIVPDRVADSRSGAPIGAGQTASVPVAGKATVPETADAVMLNVTATQPTANGWFTVYACTKPNTSNLNFTAGQTVPNAVVTPVSEGAQPACGGVNGAITIFNALGSTHYVVDVFGYFTPA